MCNIICFEDLPNEVLYLILSNISGEFIISTFQYTSKFLYNVCSDELFWKILSTQTYKNSPKLKSRFLQLQQQQQQQQLNYNDDEDNFNDLVLNDNNNMVDGADEYQVLNNQSLENNFNNLDLQNQRRLLNYQKNSWKYFFIKSITPKYLVMGSEIDNTRLKEIRNVLVEKGLKNVDYFNVFGFNGVSQSNLFQYDAILFFSYCGFRQKTVGNILADYVDNGGGIVLAAYSNCGKGNRLEGRWLEEEYNPFNDGVTQRVFQLKLGKRYFENHPILENVKDLQGGLHSSHSDSSESKYAIKIADWDNDRPLIVELQTKASPIVGLNFYPPSNEFDRTSWDSKTDGIEIVYNSLKYVTPNNSNNTILNKII
ncbi:hypothetical protein DICPUDRAFT_45484 [Dictyostelium purpureum]|uniref:F-box domain-containing protein n=1 Tax=Dictyostelium purpureum TaxID=5786 RepID=F0ZAL1_DICPU|nr:uncharacterized protein DICPUDRAFT_45484 [Dictyostelium purpureum]EGC38994.1 hypothetical protein DICPUDRAFT_45484 [Dictyostelium purpureum]|eukprot:XP_003284447.1 hypothetical protein DICPUDRAFT_45484 [Dictyostelium purpureum]